MFLCTLCLLAVASGPAAAPSPCSRDGTYLSCVKRSLRQPPAVPAGVEHLNLNWNNISRLDSSSFSRAGELRVLAVGGQESQRLSVGDNAFGNLPNLTSLDLGGNSQLKLEPEAFAGLGQLQSLWLDHNGLGDWVLERGYFRDLRSLRTLVLQGNKLQHIRLNSAFSGLRALLHLDFSSNQLLEICRGDLAHIQHRYFRTFDVSGNRLLYANQSFDWARCGNPFHDILLYTLDISGTALDFQQLHRMFLALRGTLIVDLRMGHLSIGANFGYNNLPDPDNQTFAGLADSSVTLLQLTNTFVFSLQPRVFAQLPALMDLNLSNNRINLIRRGAFSGLGALVQLNLSHNLLGEIYSWTFEGLENVSHIDLHHNHLGIIQMDSFRGLTHLVTLNLRENSLPRLPSSRPLPGLKYLLLGYNRLDSVYGLQAAPGSVFLDFSNNVLVDLQVFYRIMALPAVTHLLLRDNRVSRCNAAPGATVPAGNRLLHLDLSGNFLQVMWAAGQCRDVFHNLFNLTDLLLQGNYLTQLPPGVFGDLVSLKRLNLSLNSLSHLSRDLFPGGLEILDLSNNRLASPDPDTFSSVRRLDLRYNQYICDCGLNRFLRWFNRTQVELVGARSQLRCAFPEGLRDVPLLSLSPGCGLEDTRFALFVALTTLLLAFLSSALLHARCRSSLLLHGRALARTVLSGAPEPEPARAGYRFDAYLCFSGRDLPWVSDTLLSNLEEKRLQLCVEERDFIPGEDHLSNIRDAIWGSRKTVCVVSRRFLQDGWCLEAFNIAQSRLYHELKDVVVVLVVGSLRDYQLRRYRPLRSFLQSREYLRWPAEPRDQRWLLERLADKIRQDPERRALGPRRKGFLGLLSRRKPAGELRLQRVATVSG